MVNKGKNIFLVVRDVFSDYLVRNGHRKTPERFRILEEIYGLEGHFDAEGLFGMLSGKKVGVSRATIYNTIELLLACDLITRHQFGKGMAVYEKSFEFKQHDHLLCEDCGVVLEFCDPRIQQVRSMIGSLLGFKVTHHSLILYGKCDKLATAKHCEHFDMNVKKK